MRRLLKVDSLFGINIKQNSIFKSTKTKRGGRVEVGVGGWKKYLNMIRRNMLNAES